MIIKKKYLINSLKSITLSAYGICPFKWFNNNLISKIILANILAKQGF